MKREVSRKTVILPMTCFLLCASFEVYAQAQENSQSVTQVVVQTERIESSGQREVLAGKIVLGRDWLDRSSASTVAEALRRESSVSVSSGGKISLKGLAGYTQVLLDGQPTTGGGNPLEMDPALIERVEIIHSASADSGAFGLAGTINVITRNRRKPLPKQLNFDLGANGISDSGNVSLQGGWRDLLGTTFNITAVGDRSNSVQLGNEVWDWINDNDTNRSSTESTESKASHHRVTISPSLNWKLSSIDELQFKGTVSGGKDSYGQRSALVGGVSFDDGGIRPRTAQLSDVNQTNYASLDSSWRHKLADESTATLRIGFTQEHIKHDRTANTVWSSNFLNHLGSHENSVKNYLKTQWQLALPNREGHKVQFAASSNLFAQRAEQNTQINGVSATGDFLGSYRADLWGLESAVWAQDDWNVSDTLDLKIAWRQEHRVKSWESVEMQSKMAANLSAPSLNLAWKLDPDEKRTITLGLARSFSMLGAGMLSPRPDIAGIGLCTKDGKCGENDPNQPDLVGNPHLKYERAWGLDLSLENSWGEESQWSIRAYHRWINDTFAWITQREVVPWASVPRWVYKPMNLGTATAFGLTAGIDTAVSDWMENAPNLAINASVQWNQSRLSTIPGPDNRLENQQPWSGRLGLTYKLNDRPLELQADFLINPAQWWQASKDSRIYTATHKELSAKAIWTFSPQRKLILSLQDLSPSLDKKLSQFGSDPRIQISSSQRKRTMLSLRFEAQFD